MFSNRSPRLLPTAMYTRFVATDSSSVPPPPPPPRDVDNTRRKVHDESFPMTEATEERPTQGNRCLNGLGRAADTLPTCGTKTAGRRYRPIHVLIMMLSMDRRAVTNTSRNDTDGTKDRMVPVRCDTLVRIGCGMLSM